MFTREMFANLGDDAGVFMGDFSRALLTWAAMQEHQPTTVAQAALAFNTPPAVIREAAEDMPWISVEGPYDDPTKQRLELDGE